MEQKLKYRLASAVLAIVGMFILVDSQARITGAVVGLSEASSARWYAIGAGIILVSGFFFMASISGEREQAARTQPDKTAVPKKSASARSVSKKR